MRVPVPGGSVPPWSIVRDGDGPLVALAVPQGHDLSPEVAAAPALDASDRLREEDPFTGEFTRVTQTRILVHRLECDLNRPPEAGVYRAPEGCWRSRGATAASSFTTSTATITARRSPLANSPRTL